MSARGTGTESRGAPFEAAFASPIGIIRVVGTDRGVTEIEFVRGPEDTDDRSGQRYLWDVARFAKDPAGLKNEGVETPVATTGDPRVAEIMMSEGNMPAPVADCLRQLDAYFSGRLTRFDVPLDLAGTPFQQRVWKALLAIPYGGRTTYGAIAASLGKPAAMRAVGAANGRNPVSIIVPCHRVVGASGRLVGYGGGLWRKEWLLAHEKKHAPR